MILRRRWHGNFTVTYGEVLTAERTHWGRALMLHTRTMGTLRVSCRGNARLELENELRQRRVRVVDEYGAMITPTVADFETELARDPVRLRQLSDDARGEA